MVDIEKAKSLLDDPNLLFWKGEGNRKLNERIAIALGWRKNEVRRYGNHYYIWLDLNGEELGGDEFDYSPDDYLGTDKMFPPVCLMEYINCAGYRWDRYTNYDEGKEESVDYAVWKGPNSKCYESDNLLIAFLTAVVNEEVNK